ncbi:MAG: CBS domain-containing protein [Candidatus Latescibacterota bacterium]
MGEREARQPGTTGDAREFVRALLNDVRALERMLDGDMFETGVRRMGAEQEMFLVDKDLFPAPIATEVLEKLHSPDVGTELARFNLEASLKPQVFGGSCLSELEKELNEVVHLVRKTAREFGADVLLTGILPTLNQSHLGIENISPNPRYYELNDAMRNMRRGDFNIVMKGLDELQITHDNVLVEACSTSFQVHFQVGPAEFARFYNIAQAILAPVLASAVNSPVMFRKRLWKETRVAVFQHSIDTRHETARTRGLAPRVDLGDRWVEDSVLELIREDIAKYRVLLSKGVDEDSLDALDKGKIPRLEALCLHNGTVYRWNRFCYGVIDDKPHLRIESRALPAGPSIVDEVANAAFYFGLMAGMVDEHKDIREAMSFDDVRTNFYAVARHGLKAQITWEDGRSHTAESLILKELIPRAREGLRISKIDPGDIDRYLDIIEDRVRLQRSGAKWILDSLATMGDEGTADLRYRTLTSSMLLRQKTGQPAHTWSLASLDEAKDWRFSFLTVGQVMSTQVYTVRPDDLAEMVASLMDWNRIRYVPVEDEDGYFVGLVTYRALIRLVGRKDLEKITVRDIMKTELITVTPETPTIEAVQLVRRHQIGCLPVVVERRLLGVLSPADFLPLWDKLIIEMLKEDRILGS